jgi:dihydrofolate synthase/folylpolyglutamate synthase
MVKRDNPSVEQKAYQESLDYLYGLDKFGMIFGLTQVERILEAIGNPQGEIQAIHIGGTNGKGSTAAMMASILQEEGYRVGLYTSPHLNRFTERIKVNGKEIEKEEVAELAGWMRERIKASNITPPFTFFDFTTAMALLYFKQTVVEEHLGRSILKIAGEKAGIIKKGRPLITSATQPQVLQLFSKICREKGSPYFRVGKEFRYVSIGDGNFNYEGLHRKLWDIHLNLMGFHQIINATAALGATEVLEELGYPVSINAMVEGLKEVEWPGRLERVSSSPQVILDGAHNPAGALVLKESLEKEFKYHHLILLIGVMKDKDIKSILHLLAPLADQIILTRPHNERAASPALLKEVLGQNGKKTIVIEDIKEAIERGFSMAGEEDLLCITGSLFTVGEARAYFYPRGET